MPQQGHLDIGCLNCRAVFRQQKDAPGQANCPSCGSATSIGRPGAGETSWSGAVRVFKDEAKQEERAFHDAGGRSHRTGCTICQHRNARQLASRMNELVKQRKLGELRELVDANVDDAMLASQYVHGEFKHIVEAVLRQEIGVEGRPSQVEGGDGKS